MYTLLIVFVFLSICFSFLCSIWEAVLLSIPPSYAEVKYQEGSREGELLKRFKEDVDIPLSAILTLNTIAHTVGAIGVGAQASTIWGTSSIVATVVVPVLMTLAILILSEIIPKTIGASNWKKLSGFTVKSLNIIIWCLYPLIWFSKQITKFFKKADQGSVLSRADFSVMADIGMRDSILDKGEGEIIQNLLRFRNIKAKHIMTPRTVVIAAQESMSIQEFYEKHPKLRFSRVPVYESTIDQITGYVLKDVVLSSLLEGKGNEPLKSISRPINIVGRDTSLPILFNLVLERREHIALVTDDFGGMAGIVTMEDVIETLLGMEIVDEMDNIEDMQILARQKWKKRAELMGLVIPEEEAADLPPDEAQE
ncbi:MAG: CNNM domain-containing protein [Bacteroidota bacterium]